MQSLEFSLSNNYKERIPTLISSEIDKFITQKVNFILLLVTIRSVFSHLRTQTWFAGQALRDTGELSTREEKFALGAFIAGSIILHLHASPRTWRMAVQVTRLVKRASQNRSHFWIATNALHSSERVVTLLFLILRFFKQIFSRHVLSLFRHFQVIILLLVRGLYTVWVLETFVF